MVMGVRPLMDLKQHSDGAESDVFDVFEGENHPFQFWIKVLHRFAKVGQ